MDTASLIIIILLCVFIILVFYIISINNSLINSRNKVLNKFSAIDIVVKRRVDLIPELVNIVACYTKHEENTFKEISKIRSRAVKAETINDKVNSDIALTKEVNNLLVLSENYPELKSNTNFIKLQEELVNCEDKIAYARDFYNDSVMNYNNLVEAFPSSIVAKVLGYKKFDYYK